MDPKDVDAAIADIQNRLASLELQTNFQIISDMPLWVETRHLLAAEARITELEQELAECKSRNIREEHYPL